MQRGKNMDTEKGTSCRMKCIRRNSLLISVIHNIFEEQLL